MKRIIIEQPWGGLGDNLQYSTIPEVGHKLGFEVLVSTHNKYRNLDTKRLVWDINPFISGYTDERGNLNDLFSPSPINTLFPILDRWNDGLNVIQNVEYQIFGHYFNDRPKIYYRPNLINYLQDKVVIDLNAFSSSVDKESIISQFGKDQAVLLNESSDTHIGIKSSSIFEWVDMITSSKKFVCTFSGGNIVMAAYNKPCTIYTSSTNKVFNFALHEYIMV